MDFTARLAALVLGFGAGVLLAGVAMAAGLLAGVSKREVASRICALVITVIRMQFPMKRVAKTPVALVSKFDAPRAVNIVPGPLPPTRALPPSLFWSKITPISASVIKICSVSKNENVMN